MNNLTLLETIFIIHIIFVNVLCVVAIIMANYASNKASDIIFLILFGVATPIALPVILYILIFHKWKFRKSKQDLEKEFDDIDNENEFKSIK